MERWACEIWPLGHSALHRERASRAVAAKKSLLARIRDRVETAAGYKKDLEQPSIFVIEPLVKRNFPENDCEVVDSEFGSVCNSSPAVTAHHTVVADEEYNSQDYSLESSQSFAHKKNSADVESFFHNREKATIGEDSQVYTRRKFVSRGMQTEGTEVFGDCIDDSRIHENTEIGEYDDGEEQVVDCYSKTEEIISRIEVKWPHQSSTGRQKKFCSKQTQIHSCHFARECQIVTENATYADQQWHMHHNGWNAYGDDLWNPTPVPYEYHPHDDLSLDAYNYSADSFPVTTTNERTPWNDIAHNDWSDGLTETCYAGAYLRSEEAEHVKGENTIREQTAEQSYLELIQFSTEDTIHSSPGFGSEDVYFSGHSSGEQSPVLQQI